jgi:hypothetical protein
LHIFYVCAGKIWTWLKALLFIHYVTAAATTQTKTNAQEILMKAHDGVVAQPISQIIITSDAWLHTFEVSLPERPTQQQIDRVAINVA